MAELKTTNFGTIEFSDDLVIEFPAGLPAFEDETRFVAIERVATAPFVFLQSLRRGELAFLTVPVTVLDAAYRLQIGPDDRRTLGLAAEAIVEPGRSVIGLAIVTVAEGQGMTANQLAPVVICPGTRRGVQVIQYDSEYSIRHPLPGAGGLPACS